MPTITYSLDSYIVSAIRYSIDVYVAGTVRVTKTYTEVPVGSDASSTRATKTYIEAPVGSDPSSARATKTYVEVVRYIPKKITHAFDLSVKPPVTITYSFDIDIKTGISIDSDQLTYSDIPKEEELVCPDLPSFHTWWNKRYPFRRIIKVTAPPTGLPKDHPVHVEVDFPFLERQDKIRKDRSDFRIIFDKRPIPTKVIEDRIISFPTTRGLKGGCSDIYILYYGSREKTNTATFADPRWPINVRPDSPWISQHYPESEWDNEDATPNTSSGKATVSVYADSVILFLKIGPKQGRIKLGDSVLDLHSDREGHKEVFFDGFTTAKLTKLHLESLHESGTNTILGMKMRSLPQVHIDQEELVFNSYRFLGGI